MCNNLALQKCHIISHVVLLIVEAMEAEDVMRRRLGFRPEARGPDLANVRSKINTKSSAKHKRNPKPGIFF